jgi:hypothetical protein
MMAEKRNRSILNNLLVVTLSYDKENRQISHSMGSTVVTYTYSGDGLKRSEITGSGTTTTIWDGSEYLQERS